MCERVITDDVIDRAEGDDASDETYVRTGMLKLRNGVPLVHFLSVPRGTPCDQLEFVLKESIKKVMKDKGEERK